MRVALLALLLTGCAVQGPSWRIGQVEDERVPALQSQVQQLIQAHNALVKELEAAEAERLAKEEQ